MKKRQRLLTDEQWERVEPMLPPPPATAGQSGPTVGIEPGVF
jgi:transposase